MKEHDVILTGGHSIFVDELTEEEIENLIYIIESWSEHEGGAFLEIPGGLKNLLISRKLIDKK